MARVLDTVDRKGGRLSPPAAAVRAEKAPETRAGPSLLRLQRTLGNARVQRLLDGGGAGLAEAGARAASTLERFAPDASTIERWRAGSRGAEIPVDGVVQRAAGGGGTSAVLHDDEPAHRVAAAHEAEAVTIGRDVYLGEDARTPGLLAHELAHVAQAALPGPPAPSADREREAARVQEAAVAGRGAAVALPGSASEPMRHPAVKVLRRGGKWLLKRTTNTISKHVARHGRSIAGRAVHTVFRKPKEIKKLVTRAVDEATELARNATRHGVDDVLEEGGVRIIPQATRTPGKYRYVIEKDFGKAIGTRGETILRVVLDVSGRVVTAFPVDRFLALGLAVGVVDVFTARTAEAAEQVRGRIEAEENKPVDWVGEALDLLNPLSGGSLNEGEDLWLDIERTIRQTTEDVIREVEEAERICLGEEERQAIAELVRVAIGSPMMMEDMEE